MHKNITNIIVEMGLKSDFQYSLVNCIGSTRKFYPVKQNTQLSMKFSIEYNKQH